VVAKVVGDAARARHHVAVGQHHALGLSGAARGVQDRRHVAVDDAVAGGRWRGHQLVPQVHCGARYRRARGGRADQHHLAQVVAGGEAVAERGQSFRAGDQHAYVAVAQDVANLPGLEDRVHRHEHAPGSAGAERSDDELGALVEVDGDALAAGEAEAEQSGAKARGRGLQFAIRGTYAAAGNGDRCRIAVGGGVDEMVEQGIWRASVALLPCGAQTCSRSPV